MDLTTDIKTFLDDFSEAITIIPSDDNEILLQEKTIQAIYSVQGDTIFPLDGVRQNAAIITLICDEADVAGIDLDCLVRARNMLHAVLAIPSTGLGLSQILLSDPWSEE